jgi:phospholipase C
MATLVRIGTQNEVVMPDTTNDPGPRVPVGRDRIQHIIVVMMENRSFDHLLGYLQHEDPTYPRLDHIRRGCPEDPESPHSRLIPTTADATRVLGVNPDHSAAAVMVQLYGRANASATGQPTMTGFVHSYRLKIDGLSPQIKSLLARTADSSAEAWSRIRRKPAPTMPCAADIMKCFPETDVPVLSRLAKEFAVLVNWHSSVPGETWPNRNFVHAATSDGETEISVRWYNNETIFERLAACGRRWGVYHDGIAQVWAFWRLWIRDRSSFHGPGELLEHIARDSLPSYAFVEPNHGYGASPGNSQHPGNNVVDDASFAEGEALIGEIYNALVDQPDVFAKTLLLVTYDEHGGFYDHVPPPRVPAPDARRSSSGFDFSLCGVRVPAVAISPLIPRGTVDHTFYDHASIPKTLRAQFAPDSPPLTARDDAANDLLAAIPLLPEARTDYAAVDLPPSTGLPEAVPADTIDGFEASLLELAGAVKTQLELPELEVQRSPESAAPPPFSPDLDLSAAARVRRMTLPARQAAEEVVDMFQSGAPTDPDDSELGR